MMNRYMFAVLSIPLFALGLSGCAADLGDESTAGEQIGEAQLAVGEVDCEDVTADATLSQPPDGSGVTYGSTSADGNYNHTGYNCGHQYVVDFSPSVSGTYFFADALWADTLPSNSSSCTASHLTVGVYRKVGSVWSTGSTEDVTGSWDSGTSTCSFHVSGITVNEADVIRLAGAAYTPLSLGIIAYKKVRVRLTAPI